MIKSRDRLELIADDGGGGAKMQRGEKKSRLVQNYFEKGKGAGELSYDQGDADSYSQKKICNVFRCKRCEAVVPTPTCLRW